MFTRISRCFLLQTNAKKKFMLRKLLGYYYYTFYRIWVEFFSPSWVAYQITVCFATNYKRKDILLTCIPLSASEINFGRFVSKAICIAVRQTARNSYEASRCVPCCRCNLSKMDEFKYCFIYQKLEIMRLNIKCFI